MSDTVLVALIVGIPPTLAAIGGIIISVLNRGKIAKVHDLVNSGFSEAKRESKQLGHAEGKLEQIEKEEKKEDGETK